MSLSTWNFEYALALQSTKTISFHYVIHPMSLLVLFFLSKIHVHQSGPLKLIIFSLFFVRFISSMEWATL